MPEQSKESEDVTIADKAAPQNDGTAGEFTQMFRTLSATPADSLPEAVVAAPAEKRASAEEVKPDASAGLTQVFQQLPRPGSAPPPSPKTTAMDDPALDGGFTRIFNAQTAAQTGQALREAAPLETSAKTPPSAPPSPPLPKPAVAAEAFQGQAAGEFTRIFSSFQPQPQKDTPVFAADPAAAPKQSPTPPVPQQPKEAIALPGEFTQMFAGLGQAAAPAPRPPETVFPSEPHPAPAARPSPVASNSGLGEFTQIFQQASPVLSEPVKPQGKPVFGSPAGASEGSFTEIFRSPAAASAQHKSNPFADGGHAAPAPLPAPPGGGESFTQMFQALSSEPAAPQRPAFRPPFGAPEQTPFPVAPKAPAPAGGEFTRLMQSLEPPAAPQAAQTAPQPQAPLGRPAGDAMFAASSSGNASEFTRVMRGPAGWQPGVAAPASVAAPVAPGLAIAPAKTEEQAPTAEKKAGLSKNLVILLVVFNVLLVVALIVLAVLLLKKH